MEDRSSETIRAAAKAAESVLALAAADSVEDLSKIESGKMSLGKMSLDCRPVDIRMLIDDIRKIPSHNAAQKGLEISTEIDKSLVSLSDTETVDTTRALTQNLAPMPYAKPPVDSLKGMKILIVDDSEDIAELVSHLLSSQGATVESAENGEQAIQSCHNNQYDLVLMDLQMPVLDGIAATKNLRRDGYLVPIVAMTARVLNGERQISLEQGFTDYISKPIDFQHLEGLARRFKRPIETTSPI